MATYNGGRYIGEQLNSLALQELPPLELIVTDDGSTDETVSVVQCFVKNAPFRVHIEVNTEHLGYAANFMKAVSLCKGEFIAFSDQDDIWAKEKLTATQQYLQRSSDVLVSHDFSVFREGVGAEIPSHFEILRRSKFVPAVSINGCCLVFRRELVDRFGWPTPEAGWAHDNWVCLVATLLGRRGYIWRPLIRYRIHNNNASGLLIGDTGGVGKMLRSISLPPLTSNAELDLFLGTRVRDQDVGPIWDMLTRSDSAIGDAQRERVGVSLANHHSVRKFVTGADYRSPLRRLIGTVKLFMAGAYRSSEGFHGAIKDVLGLRH